jgi:hypothetical protein
MFQHRGDAYGRAVLWVTDGNEYTTFLMEFQAADPYVNVNTSGLRVQRGNAVTIRLRFRGAGQWGGWGWSPAGSVQTLRFISHI